MDRGRLGRGRFREMTGHPHRQAFMYRICRNSLLHGVPWLPLIKAYDRGGAARERAIRVVDEAEKVQ